MTKSKQGSGKRQLQERNFEVCSSQGVLLLAEATSSGSLYPPNGFFACRWRVLQTPRLRSPWIWPRSVRTYRSIREMLTSCEDAQSRSEVFKLITTLAESKTALLQKEARLAGMAGGERLTCCMMSRYLWH